MAPVESSTGASFPARPSALAASPAPSSLLACGNCRAPMRRLALAGHYGSTVELDLCNACDLVWFDGTETARLGGTGLLDLMGDMAQAYDLPFEALGPNVSCPRCAGRVESVYNASRWGRSVQLQCLARHGAYQSFAQFLGEKGLLRPMSRIDRARLLQQKGRIDCVNCGSDVGLDDERCPYCHSVPSLLDVARLARALDPEQTIGARPEMAEPAKPGALQCAACGVALPAGGAMTCPSCGATLSIPSLRDAYAAVRALAPALRAAAEHPSPEVVKRRLDALDADIPERRAWIAGMNEETRRGQDWRTDDDFEWSSLWQRGTNPVRAVFIALVIWFAWDFWQRRG